MFKRRIKLPEDQLRELYLNQGLTMTEIAARFDVSDTTVRRRLAETGIISRPRGPKGSKDLSHLEFNEETLRELYLERKLSIPQIAELYGWGRETIRQRMIEFGIPIRSFSQSTLVQHGTYDEYKNFDGDLREKAYLLGFRLGDLSASRTNRTSDLIYVTGGSSKREQIELIERLLAQYGHVVRSYQHRLSLRGVLRYENIRITLNESFEFLLDYPAGVPPWILADNRVFLSFFACIQGLGKSNCTLTILSHSRSVPFIFASRGVC